MMSFTKFYSAIVEGKAYYRAVRGHVMAYEIFCRIKLKIIQSWARERLSLQDLDDKVQFFHDPFADKHNKTVHIKISEQVLQLLQILKESVIINGSTRSSVQTQSIHIGQHIWSLLKLCLTSSEPT